MERAIKKEGHKESKKLQFKLNEEHKFSGMWWFPNCPAERIAGILTYSPDKGILLNLMDSFNIEELAEKGIFPTKELKNDIMLGVSCNGEDITLQGCSVLASIFAPIGAECISITANTVFIGIHLEETGDMKFKSISAKLTHLDEWTDMSGFEIIYTTDIKVQVCYKYLDPIQINIGDDYKIFLNFRAYGPKISTTGPQTETTIKQSVFLKLVPSEEKSLKEYMEILGYVQSFLSLGTRTRVYPLIIEAVKGFKDFKDKDKETDISIKIIYHIPDIPRKIETLVKYNMLFTLSNVKDKLEYLLRKWFKKSELLEPIYDIYFLTLDNPPMLLQNQFLNLVQAIESYHRIVMKSCEIPEEDHKIRVKKIINSVPKKSKDWLSRKLKYSNEPNLRTRLKEIISKFSPITEKFISDDKGFMQKVVVTRNYLSHLDPDSKEEAEKGGALFDIVQKLKIMLLICLLNQLGFSIEDIKKVIQRDKWYNRYRIKKS